MNVTDLFSVNGIYILLFGIVISMISIFLIDKGAKREDSYYTFCKNQVIPTCFWLMLGVVLIAPPIPMKNHTLLAVIAYGVFYVVFSVTSYTDKQTGLFTAGYMMIGAFVNLLLALVCLPGWIKSGEGRHLAFAGVIMACNLLMGTFAYRFGDALLYLMAQCCMLICLTPDVWMAAMVTGLVSAFVYSVVWYGGAFIKSKGKMKSRFPFTTCLFIGSLTAFFLFL